LPALFFDSEATQNAESSWILHDARKDGNAS